MPLVKYKIDENMLEDDKHLNTEGVLFGIIPQIYVYEWKNNHRGNRNPHFNKNQNGGRYWLFIIWLVLSRVKYVLIPYF